MDALLFSLAIAVGITPQLLPAVVSSSLASGSRRLRLQGVLVKRLVCIEDLGNVDVLFTDKTGTLTTGRIEFSAAVPAVGFDADDVVRWGMVASDSAGAVEGSPLDVALSQAPAAASQRSAAAAAERVGVVPFDHVRSRVSVVVRGSDGRLTLVTKGAPETVLDRCVDVPQSLRARLGAEFAAGNRVVAVALRETVAVRALATADERDLRLVGLLVFLDPPKADAAQALTRLAALGIAVKVVTGDNLAVAAKVCRDLGLGGGPGLTGAQIGAMDDAGLASAIGSTQVFARVSPADKARIVRVQRSSGGGVAFLGDGVKRRTRPARRRRRHLGGLRY